MCMTVVTETHFYLILKVLPLFGHQCGQISQSIQEFIWIWALVLLLFIKAQTSDFYTGEQNWLCTEGLG